MPEKRDKREKYSWLSLKIGQSLKYTGNTRTGPYVLAHRAMTRYPHLVLEGGYDEKGVGRIWRRG